MTGATAANTHRNPFQDFARPVPETGGLRAAITAARHRPEPDCLPELLDIAAVSGDDAAAIHDKARDIVKRLRSRQATAGMTALMSEYSLSTSEGIALMSLAEALLRTPDTATRDALIRDKIAHGNWWEHIGTDRSLFVNAASWSLLLTGKLTGQVDEGGLAHALQGLLARGGEPFIRAGVDTAMRLLGDQFVAGQTIADALKRAQKSEARGFSYSYDMLGEAAMTAGDAARYYDDYETAIHAIGRTAKGQGVYEGPGISIKLSALHPRYERAQRARMLDELLPRVVELCKLARDYDIGLNIDAEEADRLETSLDILEALAIDPDLAGWNGLGFVVQAYGKRCPAVVDYLVDLARRSGRRLMVRLVKGAYWDTEIKHAQEAGHADYPVFTRKVHTDVAYQACAKKLLDAPDAVYPQFATHNARTVAYVYRIAGDWAPGKYEFQSLYGMGEPLYRDIVAEGPDHRPCRIYAPVGSHETLLAYLVRRLLENGANSSFVNQVADPHADDEALIADPVADARDIEPLGAPHPAISLPEDILGRRKSPTVPDLTDEAALAGVSVAFAASAEALWRAEPSAFAGKTPGETVPVLNPADHNDRVGTAVYAHPDTVDATMSAARNAAPGWAALAPDDRAVILERAADILQARISELSGLIVREAGKTAANALADLREAIDFLRYYAEQGRLRPGAEPLGVVVCISPWNFPVAIFLGQVTGALSVGNAVIAKPAEETPLIAAAAIGILHEAGVPQDVVQLMPGKGDIGAALVGHAVTAGVMFTGSTEVGHIINNTLAARTGPDGHPIPLIAETGGQNALIADSSALAEQVVGDVMASAFDSAGQRCSALRLLCLQDDVADRLLDMVKGAARELRTGNPTSLATDVGPVITEEARDNIATYIERRRGEGFAVTSYSQGIEAAPGTFIAPTIIELDEVEDLDEEVFGPVLHVVRYRRKDRDRLIARINALGYGLTFGLHSRIDSEVARLATVASAGNIYVNRNIVGAVVGVQPFGGHGLSGTGPKAGGPIYLNRMIRSGQNDLPGAMPNTSAEAMGVLRTWAESAAPDLVPAIEADLGRTPLGHRADLPSPAGETNTYSLEPRGRILVVPATAEGLIRQLAAVLATGNTPVIDRDNPVLQAVPDAVKACLERVADALAAADVTGALLEGRGAELLPALRTLAAREGAVVVPQSAARETLLKDDPAYRLDLLVRERVVTVNTAAAGGNASLMTLDPKG